MVPLALKSTITKIKTLLKGFSSRFELAEELVCLKIRWDRNYVNWRADKKNEEKCSQQQRNVIDC